MFRIGLPGLSDSAICCPICYSLGFSVCFQDLNSLFNHCKYSTHALQLINIFFLIIFLYLRMSAKSFSAHSQPLRPCSYAFGRLFLVYSLHLLHNKGLWLEGMWCENLFPSGTSPKLAQILLFISAAPSESHIGSINHVFCSVSLFYLYLSLYIHHKKKTTTSKSWSKSLH